MIHSSHNKNHKTLVSQIQEKLRTDGKTDRGTEPFLQNSLLHVDQKKTVFTNNKRTDLQVQKIAKRVTGSSVATSKFLPW